jgi:hypothetical protein
VEIRAMPDAQICAEDNKEASAGTVAYARWLWARSNRVI